MPRIIQGYVLRELIPPFVISMMVFTFILLAGKVMRLVEMVVTWGVNPLEVSQFVLYIIPTFLGFAIPMAVVLAVLVGFGRLNADGELTAMKSSGISLYQLLRPVVVFSTLAFFLSLYFMLFGLPWGTTGSRQLLFEVAKKRADLVVREQVFNDSFKGMILYVDRLERQTGRLEGILISDSRDHQAPTTFVAKQGRIYSDPESLTIGIMLQNGSIHRMSADHRATETAQFERYQLKLDLEGKFSQRQRDKRKFKQMYPLELWQKANSSELKKHKRLKARIVLHEKMAIPLACFVMAILTIPLGTMWSTAGRFQGFVLGALVIAAYYALLLLGEVLVNGEKIPPFPGIWIPNILFGALAIYLLRAKAQEREIRLVAWINEKAARLSSGLEQLFRRL
ncbi:MAG: LPS export ABC transporter permease LptF [Deltaproteobacteria bacterium]|nr:LPS export ABC transporter permease LptF [Deltaproteobacteria bacterium]MBW2306434.1 LPS export ABC transporter permease LptF [Deltaproteobacteria bacterium]